MKRPTVRLILIAIVVFMFIAAGCASQMLSDDFDEAEVKAAAENVISLINSKDSQSLKELCTVQMKAALTDDLLEQLYEAIGEGGAFIEVEQMSVTAMTDEASEEVYAVVIARAKYDIKTFVYTISFTKQVKLAGLYYR